MARRRADRTRKRLACTLDVEGSRGAGMILDISPFGLFVQTGARLAPGDPFTLEFEPPGGGERVRVQCRVVRRRSVPARLKAVVQGGVGVTIEHAPEDFYMMLASLHEGTAGSAAPRPSAGEAPERPTRRPGSRSASAIPRSGTAPPTVRKSSMRLRALRKRYKVEVHEIAGKGARIVEVEALNASAAGRKALSEVGDGWKVAGWEPA